MDRLEGVMNAKLFKKIVDEAKSLGTKNIFLGGFGEPLTDPMIVDRVRYVKQQGMYCNFISNGSLWNKDITVQLIEAGLDEVRFSFYGQDKQTYEIVHRGLNYDITHNNIRNVIETRNRLGRKKPVVLVYFLTLDNNQKQVEAFREEWEALADFIEIWRPHNFGDGRDYRNRQEVRKKESCGRPKRGPVQFQYDGTIIPCCYDYGGKMILGDINDNTIPEILRGEKYEALRRAHESGDFSAAPYCNECDQLLEHSDALVYTNRHNLPADQAVLLSNSNLFNLGQEGRVPVNQE
jgi:radical SAM protein with 4Fe4S-binding SPASM domain